MNSNSDKKQSHNELKSDDNSNEQEIKDFEFQGINSQNSEINKDNNDIINTDNKNTETNDEPIYVMTLALEQGKSEKIEIFANSDPSELAYNFCSKNNLDFNALDYLREQITNLIISPVINSASSLAKNKQQLTISSGSTAFLFKRL